MDAPSLAAAALAVYGQPGDFVDNAVRESAKRTAQKIATESEFVASLIEPRKSRCWRRATILTAVRSSF
jgi:hypothetical protein